MSAATLTCQNALDRFWGTRHSIYQTRAETSIKMESIQLAQMLADLSDLNAAVRPALVRCSSDQLWFLRLVRHSSSEYMILISVQESHAAVALVNANKTTTADSNSPAEQLPTRPGLRHHKRTGSGGSAASTGSSFMSRTASPAKFDKYGRRLLTPPNTRTNSAYGSIPGTPRRESEVSSSSPLDRHFTTHVTSTSPSLPLSHTQSRHCLCFLPFATVEYMATY